MYAKILNNIVVKYPFTLQNLQEENPFTMYDNIVDLLSMYIQTETSIQEGSFLVEVVQSALPEYDNLNEKLIESTPEFRDEQYFQKWEIVPLTDEEKQTVLTKKKEELREQRNNLLKDTDWTQMRDTPLTEEKISLYASYRQSLRDVPQQPTFPYSVSWPQKPE